MFFALFCIIQVRCKPREVLFFSALKGNGKMNSDNHAELTSALGPWTRWCLLTLGYMFMLFNGSTAALAADAGSVPANCPAGYTNMGASCSRAADKYSNPSAVKCREGYTKNGLFCDRPAHTLGLSALTCPAGYLQHATNKSKCMPQTGGSPSGNLNK